MNIKDKVFIPLCFDEIFKKMYGDNNNTNKVASILSLFLEIPYEELKDKVKILNNEKSVQSKEDKSQEKDILLEVIFSNENHLINLEANIHHFDQDLINRNIGYITNVFSNQLKKNQPYSLMKPTIQINFSKHIKENKQSNLKHIMDEYLLRNEQGEILTKKLQIYDVDIENCYRLWYNEDMKLFSPYEQTIIRLGALHNIRDSEQFRKCLGELDMDEEVKKTIQHDMDEYQSDQDLAMSYNHEQHLEKLKQSWKMRFDEDMAKVEEEKKKVKDEIKKVKDEMNKVEKEKNKIDEEKNKIDEEKNKIDEEKNKIDKEKNKIDEEKNKINKEKDKINEEKYKVNEAKQMLEKEQETLKQEQEKLRQEKINLAKNLLTINMNIEEISKLTNLTIEEIRKIDN